MRTVDRLAGACADARTFVLEADIGDAGIASTAPGDADAAASNIDTVSAQISGRSQICAVNKNANAGIVVRLAPSADHH